MGGHGDAQVRQMQAFAPADSKVLAWVSFLGRQHSCTPCCTAQDRSGVYTAAVQNGQSLHCLLAGSLPSAASKAVWPTSLRLIQKGMCIHHKAPCPQGHVHQQASAGSLAAALARGAETALCVSRANIFCRIGQTGRALGDLERAQQIEPSNVDLCRASAAVKVALHEFASAMSDLNRASRRQPYMSCVETERGIIHLHRGCFQVGLCECLCSMHGWSSVSGLA